MPLSAGEWFAIALAAMLLVGSANAVSAQAYFDPSAPHDGALTVGTVPQDAPLPPLPPEGAPTRDAAFEPDMLAQTSEVGPAPEGAASEPTTVDETALRYFARQGDAERLRIEIARLRALYPDWTPPADPTAIAEQTDERLEAMWMLYAEGRYAEVRAAIAERQQEEADWVVPEDLLARLELAEGRVKLVNASDLGQHETVVAMASDHPSLLTCQEIDVLWRLAESFALTERPERAADAYRYVLTNCEGSAERLATVQKAAELLEEPVVEELLALERPGAEGGEFDPIRDEIARQALAAGDADAALVIDPEDLTRIEQAFEREGLASDALLLAWYSYRRDAFEVARTWFERARAIEDSAAASQGLALTMIEAGEFAEAEATVYPWRGDSEDARGVYLAAVANLLAVDPPVMLDEAVLQRIVPEVVEARDVPAAQQLGWYARALNQFETAEQWFETALEWNPDDEPSAYGLMLTRRELGNEAGAEDIQRLWRGRSDRIERGGDERSDGSGGADAGASARAAYASEPRAPVTAPAQEAIARQVESPAPRPRPRTVTSAGTAPAARQNGCRAYRDPSGMAPEAALQRAWCLMEADRPLEAAKAFDVAVRASGEATRRDAAYGQSLAYLRAGLVDEAAISAAKAPHTIERGAELESAILAERALGAFENGRYSETILFLDRRATLAAERLDLMVLRGYAYLNLNRALEAERLFSVAASAGSREALRALGTLRQSRQGRN